MNLQDHVERKLQELGCTLVSLSITPRRIKDLEAHAVYGEVLARRHDQTYSVWSTCLLSDGTFGGLSNGDHDLDMAGALTDFIYRTTHYLRFIRDRA